MPWKTRLKLMFTRPTVNEVNDYIRETVSAALHDVGAELESNGYNVTITGETGWVEMKVEGFEEPRFIYRIERREFDQPHFQPSGEVSGDNFARAEVFLSEGGRHYDIYGYTRLQVIRDVLRQYERHLQWLYHLAT